MKDIKNQVSYDIAHEVTYKYFDENFMDILGSKIVDNYLYVRGGDDGFPHTRATVKVDLNTKQIVDWFGWHNCPVKVKEGVYQ